MSDGVGLGPGADSRRLVSPLSRESGDTSLPACVAVAVGFRLQRRNKSSLASLARRGEMLLGCRLDALPPSEPSASIELPYFTL